jgi:hypothetical protein
MWQGSIEINGVQVPVIANVTNAYDRNYVVLSVTATYGDFSFTKTYNIRGGAIPPEVISDFTGHSLAAYQNRAATIQFLLDAGFTAVV